MVKASAPGNLFFLGEHVVLYGCPAIVTSVGKRTYVTAEKLENKIEINSTAYGKASAKIEGKKLVSRESEKPGLEHLLDFAEYCLEKLDLNSGFSLKIESEVPIESGMSSSTAVLSASLKAVTNLFEKTLSNKKFFEFLLPLQVKIHGGKASGTELFSSALGGFNYLTKNNSSWNAQNLGENTFQVVIGNTHIRAQTSILVGKHHPTLVFRWKNQIDQAVKDIEELSKQLVQAIKKNNLKKIGKIINKNHEILRDKFLVSHPKLEDARNEALNAGALGAKLSGAGWGGIMFALVTEKTKGTVIKAIESTGCEAISTKIGVEGARIEE